MTSTPTRFEPVWSSGRWYAGEQNVPSKIDATLPDNTSASELATSE